MKRAVIFFLSASAIFLGLGAGLPAAEPPPGGGVKTLKPVLEFNIGMPNEQCRFVPFSVKGERCFDIDTGKQLWVIDDPKWNGHSDVVQPTWDREKKEWLIYTCRESLSPERGVVLFDARGRERWGHRGLGHMDMGWAAHLGEGGAIRCYAMQIDTKSAGPAGFKRTGLVPFFWDQQGNPLKIEFTLTDTEAHDAPGHPLRTHQDKPEISFASAISFCASGADTCLNSPIASTASGRRTMNSLVRPGPALCASALNVSDKTIETYRQPIMKKLNLHRVAQLTQYALREGLTTLEVY